MARMRSGLDGNKWRQTHQATVDAILNPLNEQRSVRSRGNQFYNMDHWTGRQFLAVLSKWAELNPGRRPDKATVEYWVRQANEEPTDRYGTSVLARDRGITIGQTPDDLPQWLAMALVGGGYHEAWHTEYSMRDHLTLEMVWGPIQQYWDLVPYDPQNGRNGWAGLVGPLMEWSNIVEDIRIERRGCEKYPGAGARMVALQDLILKQEEAGRILAAHKGLPSNPDLAAVMGTFRDVGLGYTSPRQLAALEKYKIDSPEGVKFVLDGPLTELLDESISMAADDRMGCIWMAMRVLGVLSDASGQGTGPGGTPGQPGEGGTPSPTGDPSENGESGGESGGTPGASSGQSDTGPRKKVWKAGDRALLKTGEYAGCEVEVTWAGVPDASGEQPLEYKLVEVSDVAGS